MLNRIVIKGIVRDGKRLEYEYFVAGEWKSIHLLWKCREYGV